MTDSNSHGEPIFPSQVILITYVAKNREKNVLAVDRTEEVLMLHRLISSSIVITLSVLLLATIAGAQEYLFRFNLAYGNAFPGFPGAGALRSHSAIMGFEYAPKALGGGFEWGLRGSLSANGYYHFQLRRMARLEPFVTAGYSRTFRPHDTGLNLLNFGGGNDFFGLLRLEIRDSLSFENGVAHFPEIRMGFTLPVWGGR
jgi:hypothetical protein